MPLKQRHLVFLAVTVLCVCAANSKVCAWDEEGHAIVTRLAWEKLPPNMPEWLKDPRIRYRLEYLSSEPDRWRGQNSADLDHANNPEHYLDEEDLRDYGLSLKNLPPFRREFLDALANARAKDPALLKDYDRKRDKAYVYIIPGLLPYTIAELQWKLAASWTTLKTYEEHRDKVTEQMIDNARQNIVYQMGIISHFVGDGSQPLHLTRHHHGWAGDNPKGYTTDRGFHAYIDGGVINKHAITGDKLVQKAKAPRQVPADKHFRATCDYLLETFALVEPLYALEKSGALNQQEGKEFIESRLIEGGAMLSGIWIAAYDSAVIDQFRVRRLTGKAN